MQRGMSCEQAYREVYAFLDRELNDAELEVVRRHLDDCPPCAHLFRFEGTIVRYVRAEAVKETCPAVAVLSILSGFRARVAARLSR